MRDLIHSLDECKENDQKKPIFRTLFYFGFLKSQLREYNFDLSTNNIIQSLVHIQTDEEARSNISLEEIAILD